MKTAAFGKRMASLRRGVASVPWLVAAAAFVASGKDMPVEGTFWIDPLSGKVLKTHMQLSADVTMGGDTRARAPWDPDGGAVVRRARSSVSITVTYKRDETLGMLMPSEMLETYEGPTVNRFTGNEEISKVNCRTTYSDFRRFETSGRVVIPKQAPAKLDEVGR